MALPGVLVLFALASVLPATVWAQDEGRSDLPTPDQLNVHVIPGGEAIKVDGILDEAVWQHAVPATRFWQYAPLDRIPATEDTEVRVVQDDRALYFGIMTGLAIPTFQPGNESPFPSRSARSPFSPATTPIGRTSCPSRATPADPSRES